MIRRAFTAARLVTDGISRRSRRIPALTLGGAFLTFCAGYVNVVTLRLVELPATHLTGTVSRLSADVGRGDAADARPVFTLIVAFVLGAMVSGFMIAGPRLKLGRRYGIVTIIEAALLAAATVMLPIRPVAGVILAATAAGMQNAMASSLGGLIVRTTHVTGMLTDLGFLLGQKLRGQDVSGWKLAFLLMLCAAFFAGGLAGALVVPNLGADALWLPSAALFLAGASYTAWRILHAEARGSADTPTH